MPTFYQIISFLKHKLFEINDYSLHSPGLFKLYQECIRAAERNPDDPQIEEIRMRFIHDRSLISTLNIGAGSKLSSKTTRSIRSIARGGITTSKYSRLFQQLIRYFDSKKIVELGASLGINTLYLASSAPDVKVWTFEGCPATAEIAGRVFTDLGFSNIVMIHGNIAETLPDFLYEVTEIDFVFIDASHTYQATLEYFNQFMPNLSEKAVVILDDIYWSKEMTKAWQDIIQGHPEITSIDIYQCGILIFDRSFQATGLKLAY